MSSFAKDLEEIRQRAVNKLEEGAVTGAYRGDVQKTISILNEALATEIVCVLRYMHHYFMATGVHAKSVAEEFKEHADSEREHADVLAERIQQLGGKPDFNPRSLLERSASQYVEGENLADMIREDLIAERIVIEVYNQMIRYFGSNDPTTRVLIEQILKDEEEHASDLSSLLYVVDPATGKTQGKDPDNRTVAPPAPRQQSERTAAPRMGGQREERPEPQPRERAAAPRMTRDRDEEPEPQPREPRGGRSEPRPFVPAFANSDGPRTQSSGRRPQPLPRQNTPPPGEEAPSPETRERQQHETFGGRGSAGPEKPEGNNRGRRRRRRPAA